MATMNLMKVMQGETQAIQVIAMKNVPVYNGSLTAHNPGLMDNGL
jgi:hypothetical protein